MVETPRRRKSKIVNKLTIQDKSLLSCGDLKEYFKFDNLSDCMEQVPMLEVMAILMIHHMVVEVFNGRSDGRVFNCSVGNGLTPGRGMT